MSLPLVFHPDVQPEVDEAYRWWDEWLILGFAFNTCC
jgi:hypothetical protein